MRGRAAKLLSSSKARHCRPNQTMELLGPTHPSSFT
uniref:Uncharacterized protein n=1 Tax=Arundo donax TaxID=35708 RepID=A0A0A8Z8R5_ARUDO